MISRANPIDVTLRRPADPIRRRCAGHGTAEAHGSEAGRQLVLSVVAALPLIVTLVSELESEVRCALIDDAGGPPPLAVQLPREGVTAARVEEALARPKVPRSLGTRKGPLVAVGGLTQCAGARAIVRAARAVSKG